MGGIIISYNIIRTNKIIFIPFWIKVRLIILISISLIIYFTFFNKNLIINKRIFKWFLRNIWFLPISFNISRNLFFLSSASYINKLIEIKWIEVFIYKYIYLIINNNYINKFIDFISFVYLFQVIEVFLLYLFIIFIFY